MEILNELKGVLGLIQHDDDRNDGYGKGWYYENNDCFENSEVSVTRITPVVYKILDDRNKLEYVINNFNIFKDTLYDHVKFMIDYKKYTINIDDIYEAMPIKEEWYTYQRTQQFKHESWTWITSMAVSLLMHIYH